MKCDERDRQEWSAWTPIYIFPPPLRFELPLVERLAHLVEDEGRGTQKSYNFGRPYEAACQWQQHVLGLRKAAGQRKMPDMRLVMLHEIRYEIA